jgi:gentisate 1,2-dioxygenase
MTTTDDSVLGRARVKDTPELEEYYRELEALSVGALWTVANDIEPWEPKAQSSVMHWSYEMLRPLVLRAAELVSPQDAGRRVVWLCNPSRRAVSASVGWLYSGLQIMLPGEWAPAHRHAAAALRYIIEGEGAYTVVDGERATLGAKDFVITPAGTWHDHGNDGTTSPAIWQDGLDIPLVNAMDANFYEIFEDGRQEPVGQVDNSTRSYAGPGLLPPDEGRGGQRYSPLLKYPFERSYESLLSLAHSRPGSPYDGAVLTFVNPRTGGHVMPTMGAQIQALAPGEATKAHRHTGSFMYTVVKGSGASIIGGRRVAWKENDIFCVPSWTWHEHINGASNQDAVLFSFHDLPVIDALGLYREQPLADNDGHQEIVA